MTTAEIIHSTVDHNRQTNTSEHLRLEQIDAMHFLLSPDNGNFFPSNGYTALSLRWGEDPADQTTGYKYNTEFLFRLPELPPLSPVEMQLTREDGGIETQTAWTLAPIHEGASKAIQLKKTLDAVVLDPERRKDLEIVHLTEGRVKATAILLPVRQSDTRAILIGTSDGAVDYLREPRISRLLLPNKDTQTWAISIPVDAVKKRTGSRPHIGKMLEHSVELPRIKRVIETPFTLADTLLSIHPSIPPVPTAEHLRERTRARRHRDLHNQNEAIHYMTQSPLHVSDVSEITLERLGMNRLRYIDAFGNATAVIPPNGDKKITFHGVKPGVSYILFSGNDERDVPLNVEIPVFVEGQMETNKDCLPTTNTLEERLLQLNRLEQLRVHLPTLSQAVVNGETTIAEWIRKNVAGKQHVDANDQILAYKLKDLGNDQLPLSYLVGLTQSTPLFSRTHDMVTVLHPQIVHDNGDILSLGVLSPFATTHGHDVKFSIAVGKDNLDDMMVQIARQRVQSDFAFGPYRYIPREFRMRFPTTNDGYPFSIHIVASTDDPKLKRADRIRETIIPSSVIYEQTT